MSRRGTLYVFLAACAVMLSPQWLLAAGDADGGHGGNALADLGWRIVNFAIFAAVIYFAAAKPIRNFLNGRIAGIRRQLDDAERGRAEAEKMAVDCLAKLARLEEEIGEIEQTLIHEGEMEKRRIIEAADAAAEKIAAQAAFSAEQELKKAVIAIKKEAAEGALMLAEELLRAEVKKDDQKKLVAEYLEGLRSVN